MAGPSSAPAGVPYLEGEDVIRYDGVSLTQTICVCLSCQLVSKRDAVRCDLCSGDLTTWMSAAPRKFSLTIECTVDPSGIVASLPQMTP